MWRRNHQHWRSRSGHLYMMDLIRVCMKTQGLVTKVFWMRESEWTELEHFYCFRDLHIRSGLCFINSQTDPRRILKNSILKYIFRMLEGSRNKVKNHCIFDDFTKETKGNPIVISPKIYVFCPLFTSTLRMPKIHFKIEFFKNPSRICLQIYKT